MKTSVKILITTAIYLFLSFEIISAETFKSHSTIMMVRDSADIKTKKIFWWSDWSEILPADGTHLIIMVKKNKVSFEGGDVYTLDRFPKRDFAQVRNELGAVFCYKATDQNGKKWTVTICRTGSGIYAIQKEDGKIIVVYQ
jgi:hypothetical protein